MFVYKQTSVSRFATKFCARSLEHGTEIRLQTTTTLGRYTWPLHRVTRTKQPLAQNRRLLLMADRFIVIAEHVVQSRDVTIAGRDFRVDSAVDVVEEIQRLAEQLQTLFQEACKDVSEMLYEFSKVLSTIEEMQR